MKTMAFYQVFDRIGNCAITQLIPCANRLTAALGFRNAYIQEKDKNKNPYQYKALDLLEICIADVNDDGTYYMHQSPKENWELNGAEVMNFISSEMSARGVDDFLVDDNEEE